MNNAARNKTNNRPTETRPEKPAVKSHLWRPVLGLLLGLGLGMAVGVAFNRANATWAGGRISTGGMFHCRPGPWGDLECTQIATELPDGFVPAEWNPQPIRWVFKHYSRQQVDNLFHSAGLTSAQQKSLKIVPWQESADQVVVSPAEDLVLGLKPKAREIIYKALGAYPENPRQFKPFRYPAGALTEWFAHSGLRPETEDLVKCLLYRRGQSMVFSDIDAVMPLLNSSEEQSRLLKTLSRRSTLLVTLHVRPDTDIDALADYWSKGDRSKDIYPLLVSLARQPGGADIGLVHLLQPLPRALLYTYPGPDGSSAELERDSHWTSLNFLSSTPDNRFIGDEAAVRRALEEEYETVDRASNLGDVIVFVSPEGALLHSCAYVADNIVFTKNGKGWGAAWILMTYEDLISFYSSVSPITVKVYRPRVRAG